LEAAKVPLAQFRKDVTDIKHSLERRFYKTKKGGVISAPANVEDFLEIRTEDILVKDTVEKVK
jgi:hypothetical protein